MRHDLQLSIRAVERNAAPQPSILLHHWSQRVPHYFRIKSRGTNCEYGMRVSKISLLASECSPKNRGVDFDEPPCSFVQQAAAHIRICSCAGSPVGSHALAKQSTAAFLGSAGFDLGH